MKFKLNNTLNRLFRRAFNRSIRQIFGRSSQRDITTKIFRHTSGGGTFGFSLTPEQKRRDIENNQRHIANRVANIKFMRRNLVDVPFRFSLIAHSAILITTRNRQHHIIELMPNSKVLLHRNVKLSKIKSYKHYITAKVDLYPTKHRWTIQKYGNRVRREISVGSTIKLVTQQCSDAKGGFSINPLNPNICHSFSQCVVDKLQ